jgi:predicted CopG family antitoxin
MSKSIKVTEEVYQELRELQRTRETYNDVIARLIAVDKGLMGLYTVVGGVQAFADWQKGQLKTETPAQ